MISLTTRSTKIKGLFYSLIIAFLIPFSAIANTDIIGTIWLDDDVNNMYDGEPGVNGVIVELVDAEYLTIIATTTSAGGNYEFLNQLPGKYFLRIPDTQFLFGAILYGTNSCFGTSPADDMIDDDDNGSDTDPSSIRTTSFSLTDNDPNNNVLIEYIDFCFRINDCTQPNPLASNSCSEIEDVNILCDINILATFCNMMPNAPSGGIQPIPLCTDSSDPADNISWFGFVAYGGSYTISIIPSNCSGGNIGLAGIQVGIYQDCSFSESVFCSVDCNLTPVDIPSSSLVEGETYYLFIDGCGADVCSYSIDIIGSPIPPDLTPNKVCVNNNGVTQCDSTDYCVGGDILLEATGLGITADYSWTVTTISGGPYTDISNPITTNENLQLSFTNEGKYEVCITSISNGCNVWFGNVCTIINITDDIPFVGDEEFSDQFVCIGEENNFDITKLNNFDPNGDGVNGWQGPIVDIELGLNTALVLTPGCSYNQQFELGTYDEDPPVDVYLAICGQDLPMQIEDFTLTEASFENSDIIMIDSVLSLTPNVNGCDSIINFEIEKLDIVDGFMNPPQCTFNSVILDFDYNDVESTGFIFLNFVWKDPFGNILFDSQNNNDPTDLEVPMGSPSGIYMLTVTITKNGFSCDYIYTVDVDFTNIQPPTPTISGIAMVCAGSNSEATYTAIGGDPSFNYIWLVPSDATIIETSGPLGNMITIDWAESNGGTLSVQSENECGFSELANLSITVNPTTLPEFSIDAEVCVGGETSVTSTGSDFNIVSYLWDFDGAQVISGGSFNMGPNVLSWSTPGTKTVTLKTSNTNGCISDEAINTIEVIEPLTPTMVICQPTINDILFIWQEEAGIGYEVEVITGQTGAFEGNSSYRVTGLNGGDIVTVELFQTQLDGICPDPVSTLITCEAQDCPTIAISLSAAQNTFCENDLGETTINAIVTSQVNGTGIFSGPGIVNSEGQFDPKQAEIGVNTITYTYTDENGCSDTETIDLTVLEAPLATFSTDDLIVCNGQSLTLNYTGTQGVNSYAWQNSEITIESVPNPVVTFQTVGIKTITLTVMKDGCTSEETSINIEVVESPVATFTLSSDIICLSEEVQLLYNGPLDVDNYAWNTGVGSVDNIPNPFVSFILPGEKIIELIVSKGDCVSEVFTQTLIVEPPLDPVSISCNVGSGMIDFSWNEVQGASSYLISVNGNAPITTNFTNFNVNNLGSGEEVTLTVEAISDGSCPNVIATVSCISLISSIAKSDLLPIILYPNPSNNILFLDNTKKRDHYSIMDINGRQIVGGVYKEKINIQNLISGLYFIKVSNEQGEDVQILKFIKE
jgi:PKD repeat protein